jgi:hypothetical protein
MKTFRLLLPLFAAAHVAFAADIRVGMIGIDTGHAVEFTKILHDPNVKSHVTGARVVAAVRAPSPDIESSMKVVDGYVTRLKNEFGVKFYDSIEEMVRHVDAVMIESVDGRPHFAQAKAVILAGKPVYVEKPLTISLREGIELFALAKKHKVPVFSSSALRFGEATQAVRKGQIGRVREAETTSPASLEPHHPDLFWYGIHGVESLFTVMGTGIETVTRKSPSGSAIVTEGRWKDGRIGTFREIPRTFSGSAKGERGETPVGKFDGYAPLVAAIIEFFKTGVSPVPEQETLEILAFMEADVLSKQREGRPVQIAEIMKRAQAKP